MDLGATANVRSQARARLALAGHQRVLACGWFGSGRSMGLGVTTILGVYSLDLRHIPNCAGELKIIAANLEVPVIEKILKHLGLQARAPARSQALQLA